MDKGKEDVEWIIRKAKAKKVCPPLYIRGNDLTPEERDDFMVSLNKELIAEISHAMRISPITDLNNLARAYRRQARKIITVPDPSYPFSCMHVHTQNKKPRQAKDTGKCDYSLVAVKRTKNTNRQFTESYMALASLYGVSPLASRDDLLTALLEQNPDTLEEDRKQIFTYIDANDVIKTKGNAINGPKREDIGQYNRKIFENYTKELEKTMWDQLIVNLKFFPKYWSFVGCDAVIASDFVQVFRFGECYKQRIEDCLFLIHQENDSRWCTIVNVDDFILYKMHKEQFECALGKCRRHLNILHLETFTLYTVEFLCENAALHAYKSLSGEIGKGSGVIW